MNIIFFNPIFLENLKKKRFRFHGARFFSNEKVIGVPPE